MGRVQQAGEQIEELLARLRSGSSESGGVAEELVRLLVGLYGDGLAHIVAALRDGGGEGPALLAKLTDDPLVESLLLLHGLHPLSVDDRIQRALDQVRPYLGSHAGGVMYLGVTDDVARLRLEGSCNGCPSSTVTVQLAIEGAVRDAAPELTGVVVEGMTTTQEPALLQIGPRPGTGGPPALDPGAEPRDGNGAANGHGSWVGLPEIGPPSARPVITSAGGMPVLVCAVRGTLYAFHNACAACGATMGDALLEREVLTCRCGSRYDVTRAGRGLADAADPAVHLDPLPLLADSQGVRVAVPAQVPS
jgi:Fe-S cluster biogenesis protein NfuA/nitrite reductase/ring-hydroxylating ferredoxin subunit